MLTFIDEKEQRYGALAEVTERKAVNGEKSLSGVVLDNDSVIQGLDRGWRIEFQNEFYVVTYALPVDYGDTVELEFDAVHEFFYDFSKSAVYETLDGSNTMERYLDFIFTGSSYSYRLETPVAAFERDSFGMDNRLPLFLDVIEQAGVEYAVSGRVVRILRQVGTDLSTVVKKGFNLQELRLEKNLKDFITYKRGYGKFNDPDDPSKGRLEVEYESPLAAVYGRLEGPPVVDERYSVAANFMERLKNDVDASYLISVQLTMEDLNGAGYAYEQPHEGDYIMAVNEDLGFQRRIRIVSYESTYDATGQLTNHTVTCNSLGAVEKLNAADSEVQRNISQALEQSQKALADANYAVIAANGKNINYYGEDDPISLGHEVRYGDGWYQTVGEETILKYWNGSEWQIILDTSVTTAIQTQIDTELKPGMEAAITAANAVTKTVNTAVANAGFSTLSDTLTGLKAISSEAEANAQTAISNAASALSTASNALNKATTVEGSLTSVQQEVDEINGLLSTTVKTTEFNALTGRVATAESNIDQNAALISQKASQTAVDTLAGRVTTAEGKITTQANQILLTATKTEAQGYATSALKAAGVVPRNLLITSKLSRGYISDSTGEFVASTTEAYQTTDYIDVHEMDNITVTLYENRTASGYGLLIYLDANKVPLDILDDIDWKTPQSRSYTLPSAAYYIRATLLESNKIKWKIENGTASSEWSSAPEDTASEISSLKTSVAGLKVTSDSVTTTIATIQTDMAGKATTTALNEVKSTADSNKATLTDHTGRLTSMEQTVNGLQSTVYNADGTSKLTQLATDINLRVAKGEVVSQINLEAGRTLIQTGKLYLSADTIYASGQFITNSMLANGITADKITTGTLNAADVNLINVNASSVTTGTLTGANMTLNLNTGVQTFTDPGTGGKLILNQGRITFTDGSFSRHLRYTSEGIMTEAATTNTGTNLNSSLHIKGGGEGSYQYLELIDGTGYYKQRIEAVSNVLNIHHAPGGSVRVMSYYGNLYSGNLQAYSLSTLDPAGQTLSMVGDRIETPRYGIRSIYLMPQGAGSVIVGTPDGSYRWNVHASAFVVQSTRASKTDIAPYTESGLDVINRLSVQTFRMKQDLEKGISERKIGFIAEDAPEIAIRSNGEVVGVDTYKTTAYLTKGVQELDCKVTCLGTYVSQHDLEIANLKAENAQLKQRIQLLEDKSA